MVEPGHPGAVAIEGRVLDGNGNPVTDALVELWQATPPGFGRAATDAEGRYQLSTLKPTRIEVAGGVLAPHIEVSIFARGLLDRVVTRMYFADEWEANDADPVLTGLDPQERTTLMACQASDGYVFNIHLQGADETVFFTF